MISVSDIKLLHFHDSFVFSSRIINVSQLYLHNIENSTIEHNPEREYPSPSYLTQPPPLNSTNDTIGMEDVKRYHDHQQPTHQQRPSQHCDHRFSYYTPQPPHCHQCHHAEGHPHRSAASQEAESCVPTAENGQKP
jgi:hypothetical protein